MRSVRLDLRLAFQPEFGLLFDIDGVLTRGRKLLEGDKELKVYGKWVPFNMEVAEIKGLSAHADHAELMDWMSKLNNKPERIFIVHGEKESAEALQKEIKETHGWDAEIPELYSIEEIE